MKSETEVMDKGMDVMGETGNAMDKPLVSVCIPAYNNAETIRETMESVLRQTWRNLELVVADDCSSDGTLDVARDVAFGDPRVRVYENDNNLGMAGNWNHCLQLCRGEYLKLLCADDLIHETLIEREVELMEQNPEALLVQTDTRFIDIHGKTTGFYRRYYKKGLVEGKKACRFSVFTRDYLGAPLANLIRRGAYEAAGGFDPTFVYIIDYDFYMNIACRGKIYILHEPLNSFRIRSDSNTGQVMGGGKEEVYIAEHRRLVEKYADELRLAPWQVELSVMIRRFMSFLGNLYLKIFVK